MRWTQTFIPTLKETPQEAQVKSHRLMLRAGLIRKLASGTYSYLPLGLRVLKKAEGIVRQEMDGVGALEVLLPAIHPAEIWKESGRFEILGEDMVHFKDRHGKENVLGPTHEEVITELARGEIRSYKQLPVTFYQIQIKFRDEMRPRSGVIRSREFIMKDAYSFHATAESLDETYDRMREAYRRIFKRCGLEFYIVEADPGTMGGGQSQEFVLFSDAGEDRMVQTGDSERVVAVELAERHLKNLAVPDSPPQGKQKKVPTPGLSSVEAVSAFLKKRPSDLLKTMIYRAQDSSKKDSGGVFAVLVRGDHEVSDAKVRRIYPGAVLAGRQTIEGLGSSYGFSGPLGLELPLLADEDVLAMKDFVIGANERDKHWVDVNVSDILHGRRVPVQTGDFRQVVAGDKAPGGKETLQIKTAIELGHIFKLNKRYSVPMKLHYLDGAGKENPVIMGCYGIGLNRILAASIEQHADDKGIVWPKNLSPYQVLVVIVDTKDGQSNRIADELASSEELAKRGIDLLIDDRSETAGVKFNDADLIGVPLQVVLGPKHLKAGRVELKIRKNQQQVLVDPQSLVSEILKHLDKLA